MFGGACGGPHTGLFLSPSALHTTRSSVASRPEFRRGPRIRPLGGGDGHQQRAQSSLTGNGSQNRTAIWSHSSLWDAQQFLIPLDQPVPPQARELLKPEDSVQLINLVLVADRQQAIGLLDPLDAVQILIG